MRIALLCSHPEIRDIGPTQGGRTHKHSYLQISKDTLDDLYLLDQKSTKTP